jgi:PIN domain nuclease of toxin-antitoxin system
VKVLTDTHTLVWALSHPSALGPAARAALAASPFTASVANLWELVLKWRKPGALVADPLPWWEGYEQDTPKTININKDFRHKCLPLNNLDYYKT